MAVEYSVDGRGVISLSPVCVFLNEVLPTAEPSSPPGKPRLFVSKSEMPLVVCSRWMFTLLKMLIESDPMVLAARCSLGGTGSCYLAWKGSVQSRQLGNYFSDEGTALPRQRLTRMPVS